MKRINWELEEAVALFAYYFKSNKTNEELEKLSQAYQKRAILNGLQIDEKFRNINGLNMQLGCIHYVVTNGKHGFSSASKLFYDTYDLYQNNYDVFMKIFTNFKQNYL